MPTLRPITLNPLSLKTALALGIGLAAFGGLSASAQTTPAGPGPATQPPPAPGAVPAPTQPSAAAPAAPPNYKLQYSGVIDAYYLFNLANPKNISAGGGHTYYDTRHNSPTLDLAELNVFQTAPPKSFGYKATFLAGDAADLNHNDFQGASGGLGEARYKNIQQLYGTYAFGADGSGVDVGKFYTPFGYEVTESNGNYNYSRSTAYNYVPFYHAGARIYTPVPGLAALTATFYLVNAVFNSATAGVQDDNKKPGYIGQLNYTDPKGKFTLISELGLSKDKYFSTYSSPGGPDTKVVINDNNFTYNINANQLFGIDYVYRKLTPDGGSKETTNAYAFYYRQALTPKTALALRFSGADDKFDGTDGSDSTTVRPYDITATYELKAAANFLTRLEYRHDHTNVANTFYSSNDDTTSGPSKKDQDTLSLSGVFTF